jgi:hypothetical protein
MTAETGPAVTPVYRISLPVLTDGQITLGRLRGAGVGTFPTGSAVVLEVGEGQWMARYDVADLAETLTNVGRVSVTGTAVPWGEVGKSDQLVVQGLGMIAFTLRRSIDASYGRSLSLAPASPATQDTGAVAC